MIHLLTNAPTEDGGTIMTFKLTEPEDELDGEMGEYIPDRVVRLGLKGEVFKAMGYRYRGGFLSAEGAHKFWYKNVERDRFKDGPLYYQLTFGPDRKLIRVRQLMATLDEKQAVLALERG